jgi:hypothetical protein
MIFSAWLRSATAATASLVLFACSSDGGTVRHPRPDLYVGAIDGTDAVVAVAYDGVDSVTYVCGGSETYDTLTQWFSNHISRDTEGALLTATSGGKDLTATLAGDTVTGEVTVDATRYDFTAHLSKEGSGAGLYEVLDGGCRTGLVIPPTGAGEAQGVWCAPTNELGAASSLIFAQVTPIRPWSTMADVIRVTVSPPGAATRELSLAPVALPLE